MVSPKSKSSCTPTAARAPRTASPAARSSERRPRRSTTSRRRTSAARPAATSRGPARPVVASSSSGPLCACHQVPSRLAGCSRVKASRKVPSPVPVIGKLFHRARVAAQACRRAPKLTSKGMVASIRAGPARNPMARAPAIPAAAAAAPSIAGAQRRCTVASSTPCATMPASAATSPPREAVKVMPANRVSQIRAGGAIDRMRRSSASSERARRAAHHAQAKASARAISR